MPNLVGTSVAANYLKAAPSSQLGTRELTVFVVQMTDEADWSNHLDSNSNYSKAIRGLQTVCELFFIGEPNGATFTVLAAKDTASFGSGEEAGDGGTNTPIGNAVADACGLTVNVWNASISGDNISYD